MDKQKQAYRCMKVVESVLNEIAVDEKWVSHVTRASKALHEAMGHVATDTTNDKEEKAK